MPFFDQVKAASEDPIFGLLRAFQADPRPFKVNLSIGIYKTANLKTPLLESVKKGEEQIAHAEQTKEYLPIDGSPSFIEESGKLAFGSSLWESKGGEIYGAQMVGGTGALRIGGSFLAQLESKTIYLPEPTWPNHSQVFRHCGLKIASYPYYDFEKHRVAFDRMSEALAKLRRHSIVVLHACCHNPTGADLTELQWQQLVPLFQEKGLIPFFDFAYQGWGRGIEEDRVALRLFAEMGCELFVATSYAKNFSLYGERAGALFILDPSKQKISAIGTNIRELIRATYSNPPLHGAKIVTTILENPSLRKLWEQELTEMRGRVEEMRRVFTSMLSAQAKRTDFSFIRDKQGLFCLSGLSPLQVEKLIAEHAIYMTRDGRMNLAGLNHSNLSSVVNAIIAVESQ